MALGQRLAQSAESLGHLVLYGLDGNAQFFGYFLIGETVALAHQENLTAFFRQIVYGFPYSCISNRSVNIFLADFRDGLLAKRFALASNLYYS